jgi:hypothetical protein
MLVAPDALPARDGGVLLRALRLAGRALQALPRAAACIPVVAWLALIWHLSATPATVEPGPWWDSVLYNSAHGPLFGMLALWMLIGAPRRGGWPRIDGRTIAGVLGLVASCGILDEFHQSFTPNRSVSLGDVMTDITGAACVLWIAAYAGRPDATERGMRARFAAGVVLCLAAGALSTVGDRSKLGVLWP